MKDALAEGIFKPKPTTAEAKGDATTRAARTIIGSEVALRDAKTERLRKARLAQEALEPAPEPKAKPKAKAKAKAKPKAAAAKLAST
ncbi:hypothetical protein [Mesorhizobium sp. BE184]|uniref:hypothetical protein n=1 Tax=Mesorhizobium sp. BE184 TaxID=2817714 RepID=UPI0028601E6A|nr:hypothetical protein [Mesorhizobium sp. BE184]MDR7034465.1 hypothetical protein [Mesorhizobium sp. BE184]